MRQVSWRDAQELFKGIDRNPYWDISIYIKMHVCPCRLIWYGGHMKQMIAYTYVCIYMYTQAFLPWCGLTHVRHNRQCFQTGCRRQNAEKRELQVGIHMGTFEALDKNTPISVQAWLCIWGQTSYFHRRLCCDGCLDQIPRRLLKGCTETQWRCPWCLSFF